MSLLENKFKLKENGTNVRTEFIAGLTTFFTMAYIIFVNPNILGLAGTEDNPFSKGGIYVATIIAAAIATLIMGLVANVPYAQAPGMGLNAFFTFTVSMGLGFTWQQALAMVFVCGIINIVITVTQVRKMIIKAIPRSLQYAIGGGIGLFIAYIGFKSAGFLKFTTEAPFIFSDEFTTVGHGANVVPALVNFSEPGAQLALIGLAIIAVLMILKVKGAILIGIIATTIIGIPMGVTNTSLSNPYHVSDIADTAFKLDFGGLFADPAKIGLVLVTILAFSLSDTFDTIGTFIGTGKRTGIFDEADEKALQESSGFKSKMDKALFADSIATSIGAVFGTSNTTTYVESAAGIEAGGRTGLTSVVTALLFALSIPLYPVVGIVPVQATAPALIAVGIMMLASFKEINWPDLEEAIPAFFATIFMGFAYSISTGIAGGFIFFCLVKLAKGKSKEITPVLWVATALFILNFVVLSILK